MPRLRAPKGDGSVYFDASKERWIAKVPFRDPATGAVKYRKSSFLTQQLALKGKRALLEDQDARIQPSAETVEAFFEFWKREIAPASRSAKTLSQDLSLFRVHIEPRFAKVRLDQLTPESIQRWVNGIEKKRTAQQAYNLFRLVLARAVRMRKLRHNPFDGTEPPRHEYAAPTILSAGACRKLIAAAEGTLVEGPIRVALSMGLRRGEITGAKWSHLDLEAGNWHVKEQWQELGGFRGAKKPKMGKERTVRIPPALLAWLRERKAQAGSVYVFPSADGTVFQNTDFRKAFLGALEEAQIGPVEFRHLRSTCLSHLNRLKVDPAVIARQAGHSKAQVTYDHYVESFEESERAAVEAIERELG